MAYKLPFNEESMNYCVKELQKGNLVSFPTETVYGLGANALNENAVEKIFLAKGRPKSDPLIVHVGFIEQVESLTNMSPFQKTCFEILSKKFWPGPLTIIVNASSCVPKNVTAGKSSVAIRIPSHPVALELLRKAQIPLAAPSANRFGHVSPTTAQHVFDDLKNFDELTILDCSIPCNVGIESTVLKILENEDILLLRPGIISIHEIEQVLFENNVTTHLRKKEVIQNSETTTNGMDSPGQLLTHYAPSLKTFILNEASFDRKTCEIFEKQKLSYTVIIDFGSKNRKYQKECLQYFDLSCSANAFEASQNIFSFLRKAENLATAKFILLPNLSSDNDEKKLAIFDRIYRAASGKFVEII